jgi:hypothetical protein
MCCAPSRTSSEVVCCCSKEGRRGSSDKVAKTTWRDVSYHITKINMYKVVQSRALSLHASIDFLFHSNRFVVIYAMQDGRHVQDMLKVRLQFRMCIYFLGLNLFNLNRLFFIQSKFPMTCHIISIRGSVKQLCWD